MYYEVFLSYSRRDLELSNKIIELIQGKLKYITFRDVDDLVSGSRWRDQIHETLCQTERKPYVVVLCTAAARADPDRIVEELSFARDVGLTVIPIQFDPDVSKFLLQKAGFQSPGGIDYVEGTASANKMDGGYTITSRLEDKIRRTLISHVYRKLDELRARTEDWAEPPPGEKSFWEMTWRRYFEWDNSSVLPHSVALTARGGSGKSRLLARCIRELLKQPGIYPILIGEEVLRNAVKELPRLLGARDENTLVFQIDALAAQPSPERQIRIVFIVDGLDQMILAGDAGQRRLVAGLKLLANIAPVLIGCREEVWETYAGQVSVAAKQVEELDLLQVKALLMQEEIPFDTINPLLRIPLFLDVALTWAKRRHFLPSTATGFLRKMWTEAVSEGDDSGDNGFDWLLHNIAEYQLETLSYEMPLVHLQAAPGYMPEFESGIRKLKADGFLIAKVRPGTNSQVVRLRHDLLDNYSMLRNLLTGPDRLGRIRDLCQRCDKDCGWSLLAQLVRYASDQRDYSLKREIFLEFLSVLDRKRWDDQAMARAWAVTYAMRESFSSLFDLIVEVLAGDPLPSLSVGSGELRSDHARSTLGPPALITQEAASTLASTFTRFKAGENENETRAVPVLASCIEKWPLRARFIEALGKFKTPEAFSAILKFARKQMELRDDIDLLLYLANGLANFLDSPEAIRVLYDLLEIDVVGFPTVRNAAGRLSRVRRVVADILNRVYPEKVATRPPDEDEIVLGLEIWDEHNRSYSDWREIERYAIDVRRRRRRGENFTPAVLGALISAMRHDQTYARRAVAQALGFFNEIEAMETLFSELQNESISADVRIACFEGLEMQIARLKTAAKQALLPRLASEIAKAKRNGATFVEQGFLEVVHRIRKS